MSKNQDNPGFSGKACLPEASRFWQFFFVYSRINGMATLYKADLQRQASPADPAQKPGGACFRKPFKLKKH
jgi:hypothetical protein